MDNYTRLFYDFISNTIKPSYKYSIIFADEKINHETLMGSIPPSHDPAFGDSNDLVFLWDKDIMKYCFSFIANTPANVLNVIVLEKKTHIFYNINKHDISENFAISNNMKILYLKDSEQRPDQVQYDTIYKDYLFSVE